MRTPQHLAEMLLDIKFRGRRDRFRAEHPFSEDIAATNAVLFHHGYGRIRKTRAYRKWLELNQPSRLTMLAAKSSCKDRWTQVLTEAARIPTKHLCTLEAAISEDQTNEMERQRVVLVLPSALHATYAASQRPHLLTLQNFIELVRGRQSLS